MMSPDEVVLRRSLIVPLPWRIREHPERHRAPRGTLVREAIVALAVRYPPILETLQRIQHVEPLQAALRAYAHAADMVVDLLGLTHRRDLLLRDDLPMRCRSTSARSSPAPGSTRPRSRVGTSRRRGCT
jgi:hypothetical protein